MFKPEKATQNYCSLECAEAAIAKQKQWNDVLAPVANVIELEYLTFSKAAILMGCSRQYVYKLVALGKLPASRLSNRMSFIKRDDIEKMLQANPYYRVLPIGLKRKNSKVVTTATKAVSGSSSNDSHQYSDQKPSVDRNKYITMEEAMEIYKVSNTTIYNKVKTGNVPQCRIAGKTYYDRPLLDETMSVYLRTRNAHDVSGSSVSSCSSEFSASSAISRSASDNQTITPVVIADEDIEWLLIKDCATLYNKTVSAMKTFVYRYEIPARWIDGKRYYSRNHLDARLCPMDDEEGYYYTTSQLYNIYGINKATATSFCQKHGIRCKKLKKRILFLKEDVDKVMAKTSDANKHA